MIQGRKRRIAVHEAIMDNEVVSMCVLEIDNGIVTDCRRFEGEEPMTEWWGGTVVIRLDDDKKLRAYRDNELVE